MIHNPRRDGTEWSDEVLRQFGLFFWVTLILSVLRVSLRIYKVKMAPFTQLRWGIAPITSNHPHQDAGFLGKCLRLSEAENFWVSVFPQTDISETLILRILTHHLGEISFRSCSQLFGVIKMEYAKYEFPERCKLVSALKSTQWITWRLCSYGKCPTEPLSTRGCLQKAM